MEKGGVANAAEVSVKVMEEGKVGGAAKELPQPVKPALQGGEAAPKSGLSKATILGGLGIAVLVVLGVALGVGLGVGLNKSSSSSDRSVSGVVVSRVYYIAADPVLWSYAGTNNTNKCMEGVMGQYLVDPDVPMTNVGGSFLKAQYREYTDSSFKVLKTRPANQEHLGLLGPLIYVEAGDAIEIHFKNNLNFSVNLQPSGAIAWNDPNGEMPAVASGETNIRVWLVPLEAGPSVNVSTARANGLQTSRMFNYRSSINPVAHDNAGLTGAIIVTAKGAARDDGTTMGVDRDIVTIYQVFQETASPFVWQNARNPVTDGFVFTKMAINGYTWCNQVGLEMTEGEAVRWHVGSIGSEDSIHSYHWHGNTLVEAGRNKDHVELTAMGSSSLDLSNDAPGVWLFHCHVNLHLDNGMVAVYTVKPAASPISSAPRPTGAVTRTYYIAAEEVVWDYAPQGGESCSGETLPFGEGASVFLGEPEGIRIGSKYVKGIYFEYTDANFTQRVERSPEEAYLGFVGPLIKAYVGDEIHVVFRNMLRHNASVHPHGVLYNKSGEGTPYSDGTSGAEKADDVVQPNGTFTYIWHVPERAGPGPLEPSSKLWMYHSHISESRDTYAGLFGGIIIYRRDSTLPSSAFASKPQKPADVDQEITLYFGVMNEAYTMYDKLNVETYLNSSLWDTEKKMEALYENADFAESSLKHAINGFMYCNMPKLSFEAGARVRIHVMVLGTVEDMHTPSIGGGTFLTIGSHASTIGALPGSMTSHDVMFTQPGNFSLSCRVADHVMAGMEARYQVTPAASGPLAVAGGGKSTTYYVAAETVMWDYAPGGYVKCTGQDLTWTAATYLTQGPQTIGSIRKKALFRRYTDSNYNTLASQPAQYGLLGPFIVAEVGDVITVVFKNRLSFAVNFSPDGGFVALHNEAEGLVVEPGASFTYIWVVPEQAGPMKGDLSTVAYSYVSSVDLGPHQAAGLVGMMAIGNKGTLKDDRLTPSDVDALYPLLFQVYDENMSPFADENMALAGMTGDTVDVLLESATFVESNAMHAINGYMYCNMPQIVVPEDQTIRFALGSFGSEEGMHSPRFPGQLMLAAEGPVQTSTLMPAMTKVVDVVADSPGLWTFVCDIHDHYNAGMIAQLRVNPKVCAGGSVSSCGGSGRRHLRRTLYH